MNSKLKFGDVVLYKDCMGVVRNAAVNQEIVSVQWVHNPHNYLYYQRKAVAEKHFEVLPKDVGENLVRLYDKEVYFD